MIQQGTGRIENEGWKMEDGNILMKIKKSAQT